MARKPRRARAKKPDSRWITVHRPFNFAWSHLSSSNFHTPGEYRVKNAIADFAVEKGYATEGKSEKEPETGEAADAGSATSVDHTDPADADRPDDRPAVDHDAG